MLVQSLSLARGVGRVAHRFHDLRAEPLNRYAVDLCRLLDDASTEKEILAFVLASLVLAKPQVSKLRNASVDTTWQISSAAERGLVVSMGLAGFRTGRT